MPGRGSASVTALQIAGSGRTRRYQSTPERTAAATSTAEQHPERTSPVRRGHGAEGVAGPGGRSDEGRARNRRCRARRRERGPALWTHRSRAGAPRPSAAAVRARQAPQTPLARSLASTSLPPQAPQGSAGVAAVLGTGVGEAPLLGPGRGVTGGRAGEAARGGVRGGAGPGGGRCSGRDGRRGFLRAERADGPVRTRGAPAGAACASTGRSGRSRATASASGPPRELAGAVRGVLDVDVAEVDGDRARRPERGRWSAGRGRRWHRRGDGRRRRDVVELDVAPPHHEVELAVGLPVQLAEQLLLVLGVGRRLDGPGGQRHTANLALSAAGSGERNAARVELLGVLAPRTACTARPGDGLVREEVLGAALFTSEAHPGVSAGSGARR